MKQVFRLLLAIAGVCLIGNCSPEPLAGTYRGPLSEAIRIDRDRQVLWQPPKKLSFNPDHFQPLGVLSAPDSGGGRHLVLPSTSPYVGTTLSFPEGDKVIVADWETRHSSDRRAVRYARE